ncbi:MAG: hypothetical protein ACKOAU_20520 [Pirellula sp.]
MSLFDKAALSLWVGMSDWKFYGRKKQLAELERMLERKRWFFAKVMGCRRIGKTTLLQQAMREIKSNPDIAPPGPAHFRGHRLLPISWPAGPQTQLARSMMSSLPTIGKKSSESPFDFV